jgi:hypothetical protein
VHVKADGLYNRECAQYPSLKIVILDGAGAERGKQKLNSSGVLATSGERFWKLLETYFVVSFN